MRVSPLEKLISLLSQQAEQIHKLESTAAVLVHDKDQIHRYRAVLEEKARILSGLAQQASPIIQKIPEKQASPIQQALSKFSQSATTSLRIGSPFYMSALLYPQYHKKGEPNDLELLINKLREMQK